MSLPARKALRLVVAELRARLGKDERPSILIEELEAQLDQDSEWEPTERDRHITVNVGKTSRAPESLRRPTEAVLVTASRGFLAILAVAGAAKAAWDAFRAGKGQP